MTDAVTDDGKIGDAGTCRSCGAAIIWVTMPSGKRPPFDKDGTSHFATCPSAPSWRGKAKAR